MTLSNPLNRWQRSGRVALLLALVTLPLPGCQPVPEHTEWVGRTMGTTWSVMLAGQVDQPEAVQQGIEHELERLNQVLSTWRDDSELSRLNAQQTSEWVPVSPMLYTVLERGHAITLATDGAFDLAVGDLMHAWGFHGAGPESRPDPATLAAALPVRGANAYALDPDEQRLRKNHPGLRLDVSAIAKGFAVDELSQWLARAGHVNHLVEIGGEVRASGQRPGGGPWRIAIESPVAGQRSVQALVALQDRAIATSGDYRQYFEWEGQRYSHVIDPATGYPPRHKLASVTVVATDAMTADALATAFLVMGREKALEHAARLAVDAYFIERDGPGFVVHSTQGFPVLPVPTAD